MSIDTDVNAYETWLRTQCAVVDEDLRYKHARMTKNPFVFLRATFFRWARQIESIAADLRNAPSVLAVADTHLENFGTWRDAQGRAIWGVNDFDEAERMPYAYDLVRLATSARLSPTASTGNRLAAREILLGYRAGLNDPRPTLLDEQETWMRPLVAVTDAERREFWDEIDRAPTATDAPDDVTHRLQRHLPPDATIERYATWAKGAGSLGRPRYLAIARWRGGRIVREAKALVPSAWGWAHDAPSPTGNLLTLAQGRARSPDPHFDVDGAWIFRRVAADSRKIDARRLGERDQRRLLHAMGYDIGSIHAMTEGAAGAISEHVESLPSSWLHETARNAAAVVRRDYSEWTAIFAKSRRELRAD
jgi:hypothetical protein